MSLPPILSVENIHFSYANQAILQDISFDVQAGTFVGLIGPNGAGKSTLIKLIAGLLPLKQGRLTISGRNSSDLTGRQRARLMAYVPQSIELHFPFSVREVVRMGRFAHRAGLIAHDPQNEEAVSTSIRTMDLQSLAEHPFTTLSGGEKQRAVIASALAQESDLLLLDEPTSALDLKHQQLILTQLKQQVQAQKKTTLFVTHDINLAAQFCDRLLLMHEGHLVADGTPKEVLQFRLIQKVYGVKVYIDINPLTDTLYILPYGTL
jgi:iron complex transport system ATP-binding protein